MEDSCSASSPRRIPGVSKMRRASVSSLQDPDDYGSGFRLPGEHGPKTSEIYGFVGSITTVVATAIFLIWAYAPKHWLHSIGIFYYPNRYWALALPTYAMVSIIMALTFYIGVNFISSASVVASTYAIFVEFSREPSTFMASDGDDQQPIQSISDISIDRNNHHMLNDVN